MTKAIIDKPTLVQNSVNYQTTIVLYNNGKAALFYGFDSDIAAGHLENPKGGMLLTPGSHVTVIIPANFDLYAICAAKYTTIAGVLPRS